MPLYDFRCQNCGTVSKDVFVKLSEFSETKVLPCLACHEHEVHELELVPPAVDDWGQGKYFEHLSPMGETFYSRKSFKQYLRKHGLREMNSYVD